MNYRIDSTMEAEVGQIINSIYYSIVLLHLLLSTTRFCSVFKPLKYMKIFGGKKSIIMGLLIIAVCTARWYGSRLCKWFCQILRALNFLGKKLLAIESSLLCLFAQSLNVSFMIIIMKIIIMNLAFLSRQSAHY